MATQTQSDPKPEAGPATTTVAIANNSDSDSEQQEQQQQQQRSPPSPLGLFPAEIWIQILKETLRTCLGPANQAKLWTSLRQVSREMRAISQELFLDHLFRHKGTELKLISITPLEIIRIAFTFDRLEFDDDDDGEHGDGSSSSSSSRRKVLRPRAVWKLKLVQKTVPENINGSSSGVSRPSEESLETSRRINWRLWDGLSKRELLDRFRALPAHEMRRNGDANNMRLCWYPVYMELVDPRVDQDEGEVSFLWYESLNRFFARVLREERAIQERSDGTTEAK